MLRNVKILLVALVLLFSCQFFLAPAQQVSAQESEELIHNPELYLPRIRTDDGVIRMLREARTREKIARKATGKENENQVLRKWQNAFGLYDRLMKDFVRTDMSSDEEILVPTRFKNKTTRRQRTTKTVSAAYVPLVDYLNGRLRQTDWPKSFRDRLMRAQEGPGKELLKVAIEEESYELLTRCARFYQFSSSGRMALLMLANGALERGDSVLALKWLNEFKGCWTYEYETDLLLQIQYLRACRNANLRFELELELHRIETRGKDGEIDVGGKVVKFLDHARSFRNEAGPMHRPELTATGWRTLQGDFSRNKLAPHVSSIKGVVDLTPNDDNEKNVGAELASDIPGLGENNSGMSYRSNNDEPPVPLVFPTVHESGIFVHQVVHSGQLNERLSWFRHGKESAPLPLEVPAKIRYTATKTRSSSGGWWGMGNSSQPRSKYRVMGSSIGRVRWELDNRESDMLFSVLGNGSPTKDNKSSATGNQIQVCDLSPDPSLRVTLPNVKVESKDEFSFLKHVTFCGAPVIKYNRLYIAGCIAQQDTFEVWVFCFDVTPKGDPAEGEGKLLWKTNICAKKYTGGSAWGRGTSADLPDVSSLSEQGGMLYLATHSGCNAGLDRLSGEVCWVAKYQRLLETSWTSPVPLAVSGFVILAPYDENVAMGNLGVNGRHWFKYPTSRKGSEKENKHVLGVHKSQMIIQGRQFLNAIPLTYYDENSPKKAGWGGIGFRSTKFSSQPVGRGVIAGDMILVPFRDKISMYNVNNGKLVRNYEFPESVTTSAAPVTLTVFCRGESYKDEDGIVRYKSLAVSDPENGNIYNVEHLKNGEEFVFPSGKKITVKKETFVLMTSAERMFMFAAKD